MTKNQVTLTFDNGPTPGVTEKVLDILAQRCLKATFFVVGSRLKNPAAAALLPQIAAQGHWIGNHTLTHSIALGESTVPGYAAHEIGTTQDLIGRFTQPGRLFRPFGNAGKLGPHMLSQEALDYLLANRYTCVAWNNVPHDWEDPRWVERCLAAMENQDWSVVVMHDTVNAALPRLPELLDQLSARDVQIVQHFPDDVVLVRDGQPVTLNPAYVAARN